MFIGKPTLLLFLMLMNATWQRHRRRRHPSEYEDDVENEDEDYTDMPLEEEAEERVELKSWMNPDHPERRRAMPNNEDEHTEFVRTEYVDKVYKKVRTYSAGNVPQQVECFSCMSLSYQTSWRYLQSTYLYPKVFTDRCRDPTSEKGMPTVMCNSVCVSLMEPDVEAGVFIGFKHIRGCLDRVLKHGFNQSALRTHRFHQNNHCRTLSRAALFNPARATDPPAIGDVQLCSCYGDRCNSSQTQNFVFLILILCSFLIVR